MHIAGTRDDACDAMLGSLCVLQNLAPTTMSSVVSLNVCSACSQHIWTAQTLQLQQQQQS